MENTNHKQKHTEIKKKPVVAITTGDPNGIGCEIILKAVSDQHITQICTPLIYGNLHVLKQHLQLLDEDLHSMQFNLVDGPQKVQQGKINVINCYPDSFELHIGNSTEQGGKASLAALAKATEHLHQHLVDVLVTAPINKENIQSDTFRFSGHTEYLTRHFGAGHDSLMMMVSDMMRVALVSNHVPLGSVVEHITEERILSKLAVLNDTLKNDFLVRKPRIAVLALNPHAGDNGLLGTEEKKIIKPAIDKANEQGIWAFGPYSADGFFGAGKYSHFDAVLGMYHDQGLIPFKSLDMAGVNFTAGLDIIRTSPDHGTAYEIAGKNQANASSMRNALYLAIDILRTRAENEQLRKNPLIVQEKECPPPPHFTA